jgi:hypothetical protein
MNTHVKPQEHVNREAPFFEFELGMSEDCASLVVERATALPLGHSNASSEKLATEVAPGRWRRCRRIRQRHPSHPTPLDRLSDYPGRQRPPRERATPVSHANRQTTCQIYSHLSRGNGDVRIRGESSSPSASTSPTFR